jgi:phytanoyl-CoA hydroxylase
VLFDIGGYRRDGFAVARDAVPLVDVERLVAATVDLVRAEAAGTLARPTFVTPEQNLAHQSVVQPEDAVSKVFRVHHLEPFAAIASQPALLDAVAEALDEGDVDCFLSQFIFKNPGAWGQPCHQDAFYFPFTPARPVVGVWLAASEARLDNGCLHVVPGSHRESVHVHVPDQRENANVGYMEIVDYDLAGAQPVEMQPGDVLFFDGHLMHFSRDNTSNRRRAAMVYHYARAGTIDHTVEQHGYSINDWAPVLRT